MKNNINNTSLEIFIEVLLRIRLISLLFSPINDVLLHLYFRRNKYFWLSIIEINVRNGIESTVYVPFRFDWMLTPTFSCILGTIPDDAEAGIRKSSFGAKETSSIEKHFRGKKRVTIMSIEFSRASALLYCRLDFFLLRFVWLCCLVSPVKWNNLSHRFSMPFRVVSLKNSSVTHYLESTRKMREVSFKVTQVFIFSRKESSPLGIYP